MKVRLIGERGRNFSHMIVAERAGRNADGYMMYWYRKNLWTLDQWGRFYAINSGRRLTLMVDASEVSTIDEESK